MRRLSPVRGFVCRCAPRHTPSLKRARSRVGYVSMPARIHISAGRTGVEKHAGDSSLECVYRDASGISERRFRYEFMGPIFTTVGKFSILPCISNVRRILICRIYCNKHVRGKRFYSKTNNCSPRYIRTNVRDISRKIGELIYVKLNFPL